MSGIKVLIVEDEAIVALEMQDRLQILGYQVCNIASNGGKAIASAEVSSPDLVLMDVKLKGAMTGIEAAKTIKDKLGIPSVFITAFSDENTLKQIIDHLNYECIFKPFEIDELKEAVEKTFKKSSRVIKNFTKLF